MTDTTYGPSLSLQAASLRCMLLRHQIDHFPDPFIKTWLVGEVQPQLKLLNECGFYKEPPYFGGSVPLYPYEEEFLVEKLTRLGDSLARNLMYAWEMYLGVRRVPTSKT